MKRLKILLLFTFCTIGFIFVSQKANSQTESKSCGSCHKSVSVKSKVGDYCPHCHVRWGYENETRTTGYTSLPTRSNNYPSGSYGGNQDNMYQRSNVINNTNLRSGPRANAAVLGIIPRNSDITITRISGEWAKISFIGVFIGDDGFSEIYTGWVHRSNLVE